jgi:hypothetical protein
MELGENNKPDTKIATGLTSLVDELGKQKVQHDSRPIPEHVVATAVPSQSAARLRR